MSNLVLAAGSHIPALPATLQREGLVCETPSALRAARGVPVGDVAAHQSRASPRRPEWWDPALSQGDVSPAAMFPLVIPPCPFTPTS